MSLFTSTLVVVVFSGVAFGVLRLRTRRLVDGDDPPPRRLSTSIRRWLVAFGAGTFLALAVAGAWSAVRTALASVGAPTEGPLNALVWLPPVLGVVAVTTAGYLGAFPVAREYRGSDLTAAAAAATIARYQFALAVPLLLAIALLPLVPSGAVGAAAAVVAVAVGIYVAGPWLVRLTQRAWRPDERADRLDRLCERAGVGTRRRFLLNGTDSERAYAAVRGPPGYRTLFVTDYLLDTFDDEPAAALLASEAGDARIRQGTVLVGGVTAAGVCLVAALLGSGGALDVAALSVAAATTFALTVAVARRLVYSADAAAAQRVGREALRKALVAVREKRGSAPATGVRRLARPTPSLDERLDRL